MDKRIFSALLLLMVCALAACGTDSGQNTEVSNTLADNSYESVEGMQIKMITDNTEVVITLNESRAAANLVSMLPLELTLIERNSFAKGMTLPEHFSFCFPFCCVPDVGHGVKIQ